MQTAVITIIAAVAALNTIQIWDLQGRTRKLAQFNLKLHHLLTRMAQRIDRGLET